MHLILDDTEGQALTCSCWQAGHAAARGIEDMAGGLWLVVAMQTPSPVEQQQILQALFPDLVPLLSHGLAMLRLCQLASGQSLAPVDTASGW